MIYLRHFSQKLGTEKHSAQHYLGYSENVENRFKLHQNGIGAAITRACVERGIPIQISKVDEGDRDKERMIKKRKINFAVYCPICRTNHKSF